MLQASPSTGILFPTHHKTAQDRLFNLSHLSLQCGSYKLLIESLVGVCFHSCVKTAFGFFESLSPASSKFGIRLCLKRKIRCMFLACPSFYTSTACAKHYDTVRDFTLASSLLHHLRTSQMFHVGKLALRLVSSSTDLCVTTKNSDHFIFPQ